MSGSLRRPWLLIVLLIGCSALATQGADPPAKGPSKAIDFSKLPRDVIIVIGEEGKEALQQPGVIVLSAEAYKDLQDQIDQLKKQLKPDKPPFEGWCKLRGRVDATDVVHLQAQFDFVTRKAKTVVPLGCKTAWPTAATLDDEQLPLLIPGDDGFSVQVEKAGNHRLTLEMDLAVGARGLKGTERGFDLPLPGAATLLEHLDLPPAVRDLRIAGRSFQAQDLNSKTDKRKMVGLGPIDKLEVTWKGPVAQQQAEPLMAALGKVEVTVDDSHVTTEAELTLQLLRGQTKEWKLYIPLLPQTTVDPDVAAGDERGPTIERPTDAKNPIWTVRLKEPSADPVQLRVRSFQPRVAGKAVGIGPFIALGAVSRQQGTIKVSAPPNFRLRYRLDPRADISQREVSDDMRRGNSTVAMFAYWSLLQPAKEKPVAAALLDIEADTVKGTVETITNHALRLTPDGWQVTTEIDVKVERSEIERLEIELPPNYEPKASSPSPSLVEPDLEIKDTGQPRRTGVVKLAPRRGGQFKVVLAGAWPLPEEPKAGIVTLPLPRPLGTIDRGGGAVKVAVPDDRELLIAREAGMQTLPPGKKNYTLPTERAPSRVELAWREGRAELPVEMLVDLTLTDRTVYVQQQFRFQFPLETMRQVVLRSPEFPEGRSPIAERATLVAQGPGAWSAMLKEPGLTLDYSFIPAGDKHTGGFAVPLLWPEGITSCKTKVRVWSDPGLQPILEGTLWEELPLEMVPERESLPAVVLRAAGINVPLRLKQRDTAPLPAVAIDRALVQATVSEGGHQTYYVRYLIGKLSARAIEVELPAAPASINLELLLDGKRLANVETIDEEGNEIPNGRIVRLHVEPELYKKPVVLELRYQMTPGRPDGSGRLQTTLSPPRLRGNVFPGRVRWQVGMPPSWVPISLGGQTTVEQRWGFRGWLPAPRSSAAPADLERWFTASSDPRAPVDYVVDSAVRNFELGTRGSDVVCWQANLAPLVVVHAAEPLWLLLCSLTFLASGLILYFTSSAPRLFGLLLVLLGASVVVAGIFWPSTLPFVVYGCEPGVLILLLVASSLWWRQSRYRRQVVFMPGFTRVAAGSSVMRTSGSSLRPRGEPSTVDAQLGVLAPEASGSRQEMAPGKQ